MMGFLLAVGPELITHPRGAGKAGFLSAHVPTVTAQTDLENYTKNSFALEGKVKGRKAKGRSEGLSAAQEISKCTTEQGERQELVDMKRFRDL